jgi:hypothetical protein
VSDIFLQFYTDDQYLIKLACDYWSLTEDGNWRYFQKDLVAASGMSRQEFLNAIGSAVIAVCRDIRCVNCNQPYILSSRGLPRVEGFSEWQCMRCMTAQIEEERRQEAEKEALDLQRISGILDALKSHNDPFDYSQISCYEAILACSIMIQSETACENGTVGMIQYLGLSASDDLARRIAATLHRVGMLRFGEKTKENALASTSKGTDEYNYWALLVDWRFAQPACALTFGQVLRELNLFIETVKGTQDFIMAVKNLWWEVARDAIESHLRVQLSQYGIRDLKIGEKFQQAFDYLLERFSVPHARYIIYRVAKNAAALSTRVDFNRPHAVNTIPGSIIRDCDRALADNWNINGYTLKWDTEEPQLFTFIFDRLLGTGIGGFRITSGRFLDQTLQNMWTEAHTFPEGPNTVQ